MNWKSLCTLTLVCCLFATLANAQKFKHDVFMISLTDKDDSPYSLLHPQDYLSPRAIDRRKTQNIAIDELDLPVNPDYLKQLLSLPGVDLQHQSKWLNAVAVYVEDTLILKEIQQLPFVKAIQPLGKRRKAKDYKIYKHFPQESYEREKNYYGYALNQVSMLGGTALHNLGYRGQQKQVAIFDGGFLNVYRMPAFDSLFADNRILGTRDFVERDEFVYESSGHGTNVLSCMAANIPHLIMGTAPDAAYYLFKTEDVGGEFRIEEFNWVAAAEYADSLGVDVVNSSLGYTGFNDPSMSYSYEDLDGKTAICTQGADIAVTRGMLIVNSAGNEGSSKWHYIGAPADAANVIAVAAVKGNGERASFSSYGPTADGRIKPNVAARGRRAQVASLKGYTVSSTDGTSFSSPIMAGMVTTLWSAFPDRTNWEIKDVIEAVGHQSTEPDSSLGYGIPDFFWAYAMLMDAGIVLTANDNLLSKELLVKDKIEVLVEAKTTKQIEYVLYDKVMTPVYQSKQTVKPLLVERLEIPVIPDLERGVYFLEIKVALKKYYVKVVKG